MADHDGPGPGCGVGRGRPSGSHRPGLRAGLPLGSVAVIVLRAHRERHDKETAAAAEIYEDGAPYYPRYLTQEWERCCRATGVPVISLHDGRHTAATSGADAGVSQYVMIVLPIRSSGLAPAWSAFACEFGEWVRPVLLAARLPMSARPEHGRAQFMTRIREHPVLWHWPCHPRQDDQLPRRESAT
jgi:hypothetical protein